MTVPTFLGLTTAGGGFGTSLGFSRAAAVNGRVNDLHLYIEGTHGAIAFNNGAWVVERAAVQSGQPTPFTHYRCREVYAGAGAACTISWGGQSVWRSMVCQALDLVDGTTPMDSAAVGQLSATSSATATSPSASVVTPDALVSWGEADGESRTVTGPTDFTERSDFDALQTATRGYPSSGATGVQTAALASAAWNSGSMLVFRPATPGSGGSVEIAPAPLTSALLLPSPVLVSGHHAAPDAAAVPIFSPNPVVEVGALVEPPAAAVALVLPAPGVTTGGEETADAVEQRYYTYVADDGVLWAVKVDRSWGEHPDSGAAEWVAGLPVLTKRSNAQARRIVLQDFASGRWTTRVVFTPTAAAWVTPGYSTEIPVRGAGGAVLVHLVERRPERIPRPRAIHHKPQPEV